MGSVVLYIIEWAFALLVLIAIYKAAFSGTTLHRFNRFYLLGATLLSALLPLVHVTISDSTPVAAGLSIEETNFARELSGTFTFTAEPQTMWADAPDLATSLPEPERKTSLWAVFLIGTYSIYVLTLIIGWSRGIIKARKFLRGKPRRRLSRTVWLVTHSEQYGPFSWMNYIVISDSENGFARRASLRHEYSHVKLLHSIDLVVLLACTIVNPVCWLVLQKIKIVHEYEADDEVINRYGIQEQDYQRLLLIKAVGAEAYALASSFNLNIKKRIIMMNKNKTRRRRLMWLLLLIPLLGMTSVLFARTEKAVNLDDKLRFTQSNVEMSFRLPEPMIDYSSGSPASTRTSSSASARTVPPPPAAVTRAEYIRVIGDDEEITEELSREAARKDEMIIRERNVMTIQINKNNEIYVNNGLIKRVITIDELKDLAKQFIQNPDNDNRLPVIEDYDIEGYGTVQTTYKHVFSLQYDRSSSAGVWSDVRYELQKAYNELRDELCVSRFGKDYDQCTDSQQQFARGMYPMKISEAQPKVYGGAQGELIKKEVKSAAGNYVVKDDKVNKDLRIRVTNSPVRLYVSTVMFDNENGQDRFRSETTPKQISLEGLDDYIDQAISDGMKIRKVRLSMHPDVPMGPIFDLKETLRNRMLLNLVMESYKEPDVSYTDQPGQSMNPTSDESQAVKAGDIIKGMVVDVSDNAPLMRVNIYEMDSRDRIRAASITDMKGEFSFKLVDPDDRLLVSFDGYFTEEQEIKSVNFVRLEKQDYYPYNELVLEIKTNGMEAQITENRRDNNGKQVISTSQQKLDDLDQLEKYIDKAESDGKHIRNVALNVARNVESGLLTDVKNALRKKRLLNIRYIGNAANLDISFNTSDGQQMDLTKDVTGFPVLLVYDYSIIEKDKDSKDAIDLDKGSYTQKELAAILGVKPEQVKAFMIRNGIDASSIWGSRGNNGVLEVLSPQKYSQLQKEGKLDVGYQLAN